MSNDHSLPTTVLFNAMVILFNATAVLLKKAPVLLLRMPVLAQKTRCLWPRPNAGELSSQEPRVTAVYRIVRLRVAQR